MKGTHCILGAAIAVAACTPEATSADTSRPALHRVIPPGLGISFDLPQTWVAESLAHATVYSAPAGTAEYFATVTVEAMQRPPGSLADTLAAAYATATTWPQFAWDERTPTLVAGEAALRYTVRFEKDEVLRRQIGLVLERAPFRLCVRYAAPAAQFDAGQWIFERIVQSMRIEALSATGSSAPPDGI